MTIQILPARLANQIAAGEVVERPASVIKELVENSLDAGATRIEIDIEKGGAKRIRITDNGKGIPKGELSLALSRHATSKIKDLNDLEAISSLGFRGEALASISSVARLTLTSKPAEQENAWQACTEGRDMAVSINPAAHPDGTTINVEDLFFNTPARRKFLRTEKTEFSHIEEVIRRIALARFDVAFILKHNHKIIRQYRAVSHANNKSKRVAQICGQKFIENALEVDCTHDNLHLSGWLSTPEFTRSQNDLCYSYVNGRMMKDKLINHAIRQAYADMLPSDSYPAFVLFLTLDFKEVDVNVHPAKHEVRFHQGRYVHDFILSVCHNALLAQPSILADEVNNEHNDENYHGRYLAGNEQAKPTNYQPSAQASSVDYIAPLRSAKADDYSVQSAQSPRGSSYSTGHVSAQAQANYQALMTPLASDLAPALEQSVTRAEQMNNTACIDEQQSSSMQLSSSIQLSKAMFIAPKYMAMHLADTLRLVSLSKLEQSVTATMIESRWQEGLVSQPLLLPVKITLDTEQISFFQQYEKKMNQLGIIFSITRSTSIQIRQFPALLRDKDVNGSILSMLALLMPINSERQLESDDFQQAMSELVSDTSYDEESALLVIKKFSSLNKANLTEQLLLNSVDLDLTSAISKLN